MSVVTRITRVLQGGPLSRFEMKQRGYEPLENGYDDENGPAMATATTTATATMTTRTRSRRSSAVSGSSISCRRVSAFYCLGLGLIGIIFYATLRNTISHYGTALHCKYEISKLKGLPPVSADSRSGILQKQKKVDDETSGNEDEDEYANGNGNDDESTWSKIVNASEIINTLLMGQPERVPPRILHQSWKNENLPKRFAKWSKSWRKMHGVDWTYVLWTDADNRALVENFYPEFLETYNNLPKEIYRADMVRNMYMHRFGGIYADLDLVPLSPIPDHLPALAWSLPSSSASSTSASRSTSSPNSLAPTSKPPIHVAYVGRMSKEDFEHSIPNAFMATTSPGHPFWLKPLEFIQTHINEERYNHQPEELTGPVALRSCVNQWKEDRDQRHGQGIFDIVEVLDNGRIYPFSWNDAPFVDQCVCRPQSTTFDALRCNSLYPNAWTITYWSHSWEEYSW